MLQSLWSRLRGSRSLLPTRDLFDADLDRARGKPGCALCRLVQEHDQHSMHSFLWEYCTDPHIGMKISNSWGFCSFHIWSLAILEHERMGDGLGITIVYQALLRQLFRYISSGQQVSKQSNPPMLPEGPEVSSTSCRFCQAAQREESLFLSRLVKRFQQAVNSDGERDWSPLHTTLCLPHIQQFLQRCAQEGAVPAARRRFSFRQRSPKVSLKDSMQGEMHSLTASLSQSILQLMTELGHGASATQAMWSQVAPRLALLVGDREALPVLVGTNTQRIAPRQLLLVIKERSTLQSPVNDACPVCSAEASACIERFLRIASSGANLSTIGSLCQCHHWILAPSIFLQQTTDSVEHYQCWLEQQLEQQLAALTGSQEERVSQGEQHCTACMFASEVESEVIASIVQGLRRHHDDSMATKGRLLCLYHWKQVHKSSSSEQDTMLFKQRLLEQQLHHITALDRNVEAYIARFNASKRGRSEIPGISEAAWAWERLLAFFAGEPALVYKPQGANYWLSLNASVPGEDDRRN